MTAVVPPTKVVRLHCGGLSVALVLFDQASSDSLVHAVAARIGLRPLEFYCTRSPDPADALVPLCSALPDGMELWVHKVVAPTAHCCDVDPVSPRSEAPSDLPRAAELAAAAHVLGIPANESDCSLPSKASEGITAPLLAKSSAPQGTQDGAVQVRQDIAPDRETSEIRKSSRRKSWTDVVSSMLPAGVRRTTSTFSIGAESDGANNTGSSQTLLKGMERLGRLNTELANERTLLAWMRTALAAIRTVFTFLVLKTVQQDEHWTLTGTELAMSVLIITSALTGVRRYQQLKNAILNKDPPSLFGRLSAMPSAVLFAFVCCVTAAGIMSQQWVH